MELSRLSCVVSFILTQGGLAGWSARLPWSREVTDVSGITTAKQISVSAGASPTSPDVVRMACVRVIWMT